MAYDHEEFDPVNKPEHYNSGKARCPQCNTRIECIEITKHEGFNIGNAIKYLWRHKHKNGVEDLRKAIWYINNEIEKLDPPVKEKEKQDSISYPAFHAFEVALNEDRTSLTYVNQKCVYCGRSREDVEGSICNGK